MYGDRSGARNHKENAGVEVDFARGAADEAGDTEPGGASAGRVCDKKDGGENHKPEHGFFPRGESFWHKEQGEKYKRESGGGWEKRCSYIDVKSMTRGVVSMRC